MSKNTITGLQDGVNASKQTQETLIQRGIGSTKVALATLALVTSIQLAHAEPASSSPFVANPAYDQIIAEAQRAGKDPVEVAKMKKDAGEWNIKQYVEFSKYNRGLEEQVAIADEKEIAALKAEKASLLEKSAKNQAELDVLIPEINKQYRQYIALFEVDDKNNNIGPTEIKKINDMYNDKITYPDIKKDIGEKLGKYLKNGSIKLAQR